MNEESDSSGDRRAVGSRFHAGPGAIRSKAALASRRPSPGHQEGCRHTEVGQVTWRCVVQTLPHHGCSLRGSERRGTGHVSGECITVRAGV